MIKCGTAFRTALADVQEISLSNECVILYCNFRVVANPATSPSQIYFVHQFGFSSCSQRIPKVWPRRQFRISKDLFFRFDCSSTSTAADGSIYRLTKNQNTNLIYRGNFAEFCRVKFTKNIYYADSNWGNKINGSRCFGKISWCTALDFKPINQDSPGRLVLDNKYEWTRKNSHVIQRFRTKQPDLLEQAVRET